MKNIYTHIQGITISVILLLLSTHLFGQTWNETYIAGDATLDSVFEASLPEIVWTQEALTRSLPSSVDNSSLPEGYMPPIFNQCQTGSCVQCSEIAYTFTYEMNRLRGISAGTSWTGTEEQRRNLYHPFYTYNFLNNGNGNGHSGTQFGSGFKIVYENGCPSLNDYYDPILNEYINPGTSEESHDAVRRWMDGSEKYVAASENRILRNGSYNGSFGITWGNTYGTLDYLKRWLYNHNSNDDIGGIAVISVYMGEGFSTARIPEGSSHANEHILTAWAPTGGHAMTIVGYDDEVCCFDYNGNNIFDTPLSNTPLNQCEKGAFKVANSWGPSWKNQGYIWIPYSLMLGVMNHNYRAYTCMATTVPEKTVFLSATVKHPKRDELVLYVGKGSNASVSAPEDASCYNIFNWMVTSPGTLPMNGILRNPQPIELALNFGEKYSPYNCGKYFFQVVDNFTGNHPNGSAYVDNLQLHDYRWGEVFVLDALQPYAQIQSHGTTTLSVDYDLIYPFDIQQNCTYSTNKVARRTVTVGNQATLTISDGVSLDMYGTEAHDCKLVVESGSSLVIGDNAVISAKRGDCEIVVNGNVQIGQGVRFQAENGATLRVLVNGQQEIVIRDCHFVNASLQISAPTGRFFSFADASSVTVSNCMFRTTMGQCQHAMRIDGYSNIMIADNTVDGTGVMSSRHYDYGIMLFNCGTAGLGSLVLRNTIKSCNETGLTLYGTAANVKRNEVTQCRIGVRLLNGSTVSEFTGNCGALSPSLTQHIHDNDECEVSIYRDCIPQTFRYNRITSTGNGWFVEYENNVDDDKGLCVWIDLENNNWGNYTDTQISSRFNYVTNTNNGVVFDYLPKWALGNCTNSGTEMVGRMSREADSLLNIGLYSSAKAGYREIVELYPNTTGASNAMKKLLIAETLSEGDYSSLQQYYRNETVIQEHENLGALAGGLANKCDEMLEHYDEAIAWYEAIIQDEDTPYNDSIFATIDLGNLYLKMEANGAKGAEGTLSQFVPKSAEAFAKQTDEALKKLKSVPRRPNPNRELPDQYWTDLVTEQPEGYVVDANGNVRLYSAEALAWLCSVTNGLNGQEADDLDGKKVTLEANVDMSAALWTPISTNTNMPAFSGAFDGKEHVIGGLQMKAVNIYSNRIGFFGNIADATLSNIVLRNGYLEGFGYDIGFFVSQAFNSTIDHCFVECEMHGGEITPFIYESIGSRISNSMVYSPLMEIGENGLVCGIFVANNTVGNGNETPEIVNCASIIEKMEWSELCGFVGGFNHGAITNCYAYIGEVLNFPGYSGESGPRNGITKNNMGEISNCYYNRIPDHSPSPNHYLQLDDSPALNNEGIIRDAMPFVEDGIGHWKLTELISFNLPNGTISSDDLLDALNHKVEELDDEMCLNWCDSGMSFDNQSLPVFCDFDVTNISDNFSNQDQNQVVSYPSPTSGLLRISGMDVAELQVSNLLGQTVKTARNTNEIDLKGLPRGLYLLRVKDGEGTTVTKRIVVQ